MNTSIICASLPVPFPELPLQFRLLRYQLNVLESLKVVLLPLMKDCGFGAANSAIVGTSTRPTSRIRIEWVPGIDETRTAGAYYLSLDFLDRFADFAVWFASLKLALQFNEGLIGTVEPLRQNRCNVKEGDRVFPEQGGRIRDVKL
jgi:hypothetical protein